MNILTKKGGQNLHLYSFKSSKWTTLEYIFESVFVEWAEALHLFVQMIPIEQENMEYDYFNYFSYEQWIHFDHMPVVQVLGQQ